MTEAEKPDDGLLAMIKRALNPKQEEPAKISSLPEPDAEPDPKPEPEPEPELEAPKSAAEQIPEPMASETVETVQPVQPEPAAEPSPEAIRPVLQSRIRTADEVQKLILDALIQIPDAPKHGMTITVYGYRPWNAMVSFAPGSARSSTAAIIRSALIRVVDEMRSRIDVEMPPG